MTVKNLLEAKRDGRELSAADIAELVRGYAAGDVPDYQMAAFAMAVCCRGMTDRETAALTEAMTRSGAQLDWSDLDRPTADKHSTGGVGDKLSLVVQPLAATCGVAVPSLTGRGLGHTGGTADKLETIPGYDAGLSAEAFRRVVGACGCSMTVQTAEIAPADRKLYALRDVTGTVASIPLICASILSKKLAEGAGALVFDVKCGKGAFMRTVEDARNLAKALVGAARAAGRKASALVTRMDEPLGATVGNANEVREAIEILEGRASPLCADETALCIELAAEMVFLAKGLDRDRARDKCREHLANGRARAVFGEMVRLQGGDLEAFARLPSAPFAELKVERTGHLAAVDARVVADVALELGAGRRQTGDAIDPAAGVELLAHAGDAVTPGMALARVCGNVTRERLDEAAAHLAPAFAFSEGPVRRLPPVIERIA